MAGTYRELEGVIGSIIIPRSLGR